MQHGEQESWGCWRRAPRPARSNNGPTRRLARWISASRRISMGNGGNRGRRRRPQEGTMRATAAQMSTKAITRWVVGLTAVGSLMAAIDTLVVANALSTIRVDLDASVEQLEWTVNAYNLSFAVLLVTGAALGDRFGRRRLYAVGLG